MTEHELIQALRELIAKASAGAPDPRLMAREISRRDQQRIRLLAGLSIFFWLLAAAGLVLLCVGLDRFVIYVRIADYYPNTQPDDAEPHDAKVVPLSDSRRLLADPRAMARIHGTQLLHQTIWYVAGSIGSLFLAALCTVSLVTASRRATLQQINLNLMQLAEQVRQLQSANASEKIRRGEAS
ncbi:MAG TPA: hypothetical protein VE999_08900 [Gemmataceae bacterium]|nr:hypothetical protein [Gemmataceae bacterium]